MKPAIVTFAMTGADLDAKLAPLIDGELLACGANGADAKIVLPRLYAERRPIIGICAAGILIRLLASSLSDKQTEPPVLALSRSAPR